MEGVLTHGCSVLYEQFISTMYYSDPSFQMTYCWWCVCFIPILMFCFGCDIAHILHWLTIKPSPMTASLMFTYLGQWTLLTRSLLLPLFQSDKCWLSIQEAFVWLTLYQSIYVAIGEVFSCGEDGHNFSIVLPYSGKFSRGLYFVLFVIDQICESLSCEFVKIMIQTHKTSTQITKFILRNVLFECKIMKFYPANFFSYTV